MRRVLAALAFSLALGAPLAVTSCATIEQLRPQSAREAYAAAEIAFVGAIQTANTLVLQGAVSEEDGRALLARFEQVQAGLNEARRLLTVGEQVEAAVRVRDVQAILRIISVELTRIAEAAAAQEATP